MSLNKQFGLKLHKTRKMKNVLIGFLAIFIIGSASAQCVSDFDFGIETYGSSPDPSQGEQFEPGITDEPYYDVLHLLIPTYVLEIDSTLPFSPTALLDSIELVGIEMVDLNTLTPYTLSELGLEVVCNNNGDSNYPCSFHGGNQYCASLEGTPTMSGNFRADITVKGWTLVFGFPFGQEQLFGSLFVDFGTEGCTDPLYPNYDPAAVIDDGSCAFDNPCGLEGTEVATISYSYTAIDLSVDVGDLVYWVNYGGFHDVNGNVDSQTGLSFGNPEAFSLPAISGNPSGVCMGSHTFTIPGVYSYDCSIGSHAALGMVGTVTVGVGGCMDSAASNYNAAADYDDGSCNPIVDCFGDLNNDSSVTVADLLLILSEFGCISGCTTDINGDGLTTVSDLLELLSVFGTAC